MDRFTSRIKEHVYYTKGKYDASIPAECEVQDVRNILQRLAEYEDTGLDPEEINKIKENIEDGYMKSITRIYGISIKRMKELAEADRNGQCVLFPCRVDKDVYRVNEWISTRDKLPEKDDKYLCYYGFLKKGVLCGMMFIGCLDYYATDENPHFQHESTGLFVTHWMPLPKAPEE